jgi:rubredoxin
MEEIPKIPTKYECIVCGIMTTHKNDYNKHLMTAKHKKMQKNVNENPKIPISYECIVCGITTIHKNDYNKHIMTSKHKKCKKMQKNVKENPKIPISYECIDCNFMTNNKNNYNKHLSTIKHLEKYKKEKEKNNSEINKINENLTEKLIKTLIQQNKLVLNEVKETQEKLIEIVKDGKIINNTINNNPTFNLNFFLNETCKDAISIEECINSIEVTDDKFYLLSTFEKSGAKRG